MLRRNHLFVWLPLVFLLSCKKDTEVIPGNQPPADLTVTESRYRQYVNRCFIQVHGFEPGNNALNTSLQILKADNFSINARMNFLDTLFNNVNYRWQVFNAARQDYLNNTDTVDIRNQIMLFNLLLSDSTYILVWPALQYEVGRLNLLADAGTEYASGMIDIRELNHRFVNNYFYDQINMGSENFVKATFEQFLKRFPQSQELAGAVSMVDGNFSSVLLKGGSSKEDYLNILFSSADYEEGTVIGFYQRYLTRTPTSVEMSAATLKYHQSDDYEQIQKDILVTDEFAAQ